MGSVDNLFVVNDAADSILLGCFFFGLVFSAISLLFGAADAGIGHGPDGMHVHADHQGDVSPLSLGSLLAFVTWFGGVAYLARNALDLPLAVALIAGGAAGYAGGWLIYRAIRMLRRSAATDGAPAPRIVGSFGRVTAAIRPDRTGEIVYELRGARQVSAARSANGEPIEIGTEVVVLRRTQGIAYVETWQNLMDGEPGLVASAAPPIDHPPPLAGLPVAGETERGS